MLLLLSVLVVGAVVGLAFGGSLRSLMDLSFRWWPLALAGLVLQFIPSSSHVWAVGLLVGSYVVLTVFFVANIRMPGMWLLAAGFVLNVIVIAANGGMPVGDHALHVAYGKGYAEQRRELATGEGGAKHHLQRPGDKLVFLTDVVPVPAPIHIVVSAGDLLSMIGAGWVVAGATLGGLGGERGRGAAETPATGADVRLTRTEDSPAAEHRGGDPAPESEHPPPG